MPIRESYSDTFTGQADSGIRAILYDKSEDDGVRKLRKLLLNVINNELTPRQKEIIVLYYFKRTDIVTISKQLNITCKNFCKSTPLTERPYFFTAELIKNKIYFLRRLTNQNKCSII